MKKYSKPIFAFLSFLIIMALLLEILSLVMIPKDGEMRKIIRGIYEEKTDSLDTVFMGDSSLYRSVIPAQLWKEQGIASYTIGAPSMRPTSAYYLLKDVLEKQKPKVVVFEVNCVFNTHKYTMGNKRTLLDHMRNGGARWEAIMDGALDFSFQQKLSLLFPIFMYHNRYNEVTGDDIMKTFTSEPNDMKGFLISGDKKPYRGKLDYMRGSKEDHETFDEQLKYLDKIRKLCEKNGSSLMLLKVPGPVEWNRHKMEITKAYAKNHELPYLDLNLHMKQNVDWKNDTTDKGVHLNLFGAEKVTSDIGDFMKGNYSIKKTEDMDVITSFDHALQIYEEKKEAIIKKLSM